MFENLRKRIKELAKKAVLVAEAELGSGNGQEKKALAINYIVKRLPLPPVVKTIVSVLLSSFIDDVVEISVEYMNSLPKTEGE